MKEERYGISGSTLKIIAVISMLFDHVAAGIIDPFLISRGANSWANELEYIEWKAQYGNLVVLSEVMMYIGRLAFPLFAFLLVQGFCFTKNRTKYAIRLGIFALISEVPFNLTFYGEYSLYGTRDTLFTLLLGFLAMCVIDRVMKLEINAWVGYGALLLGSALMALSLAHFFLKFTANGEANDNQVAYMLIFPLLTLIIMVGQICYSRKQTFGYLNSVSISVLATAGFMWIAEIINTDYAAVGVLVIVVIYALRKGPAFSLGIASVILTMAAWNEITAFFSMIPVLSYNGKRGLKMKYFFYILYPAHLIIIYVIARALGYRS